MNAKLRKQKAAEARKRKVRKVRNGCKRKVRKGRKRNNGPDVTPPFEPTARITLATFVSFLCELLHISAATAGKLVTDAARAHPSVTYSLKYTPAYVRGEWAAENAVSGIVLHSLFMRWVEKVTPSEAVFTSKPNFVGKFNDEIPEAEWTRGALHAFLLRALSITSSTGKAIIHAFENSEDAISVEEQVVAGEWGPFLEGGEGTMVAAAAHSTVLKHLRG